MNKIDNKKNTKLLMVGLVALLVMVIGATYAYFAVTTVSNFGTSIINATAGPIGSVTLNGNNAQLNLSVTALDMVQGNSDVTYYASGSGTTTTPTFATLGTATVTPNTDTNTYHCTYTLSVTHTGTNDMYTVFSSATNKSAGQIILTINGVDYDFYDGWPTNNQVTGEFYTNKDYPQNITAGLRLINDSDINQNYLANTDIQISISLVANSLSCVADSSESFIAVGTDSTTGLPVVRHKLIPSEEFYDITNAINYNALIYGYGYGNIYNYESGKSILLAKHNLYVGRIYDFSSNTFETISPSDSRYGLQSASATGYISNSLPSVAVVPFCGSVAANYGYWHDNANSTIYSKYGSYSYGGNNIYDTDYVTAPDWSVAFSNNAGNANYSVAYYVEGYIDRLGIDGVGRLLTVTEVNETPGLTQTQRTNGAMYWLGTALNSFNVLTVNSTGDVEGGIIYSIGGNHPGVRPVIVVNTSDIETN